MRILCSLCTAQCVLQPPFFGQLIIRPQSVDSGLLVPAVDSVVVSGECEVAESSTSAKESGAQKVPAKPSRPDTLKKAKKPRVLKTVTIAQRVEKYGKYGLYDNNGKLYCKPCGKKMDETREDSLTRHVISGIHDAACAKVICAGAQLVLFSRCLFLFIRT